MWETWVQPLSCEDPLEKGMATHSSSLAWRIPWQESQGVAKSQTRLSNSHTHTHTHTLSWRAALLSRDTTDKVRQPLLLPTLLCFAELAGWCRPFKSWLLPIVRTVLLRPASYSACSPPLWVITTKTLPQRVTRLLFSRGWRDLYQLNSWCHSGLLSWHLGITSCAF